jgi:hypothetical protein
VKNAKNEEVKNVEAETIESVAEDKAGAQACEDDQEPSIQQQE